MTKEEAIKNLLEMRDGMPFDKCSDWIEACDIAIDALKSSMWTPCSEGLPEEREWIVTEEFGTTISNEVYVTFEDLDGVRFTEHICFQNGKLSNYDQCTIDAFYTGAVPIAWMLLPEPWKWK